MTGSKKRLKMLRLRRFWPTLACTIPGGVGGEGGREGGGQGGRESGSSGVLIFE